MFSVKTWDVIIVGAGIIGLSLARELKKRNLRVLVVEKGEPGREASHAAGGMLADCGDENPPQLQPLMTASARMYPEFVHELEDESGVNVDLRDAGTILLGSDSHCANTSSKASSEVELANLEPNFAHLNVDATLVAERSVDPRALSSAALKACRHREVDVSSGDAVVSVTVADGHVMGVVTAKTSFQSTTVVNCAGAWSCRVGPYPVPTRPMKGQMLCVAMPSRDFLRHVVRSPEVYLIPRSDGRLLIGATVEDVGYDKRVNPDTIRQLRQSALNLMPGLSEARMLEDWAGLRPGTPDGLPILGATPVSGYFVATGHFRDGILLAPITAKLITELIVDGKTGQDLSLFACGRFSDVQF
jgi:glycine oxidase